MLYGFGKATYTLPAASDTTPVAAPPVRRELHGTVGWVRLAAYMHFEPPVHTHQSVATPLTERRTLPNASTTYTELPWSMVAAVMAGIRATEPVPLVPVPM